MIRAFSSPPFAASVFFSVALSKTTFNVCRRIRARLGTFVRRDDDSDVVPFGAWMNFLRAFDCLGSIIRFLLFSRRRSRRFRIVVVVVVLFARATTRRERAVGFTKCRCSRRVYINTYDERLRICGSLLVSFCSSVVLFCFVLFFLFWIEFCSYHSSSSTK